MELRNITFTNHLGEKDNYVGWCREQEMAQEPHVPDDYAGEAGRRFNEMEAKAAAFAALPQEEKDQIILLAKQKEYKEYSIKYLWYSRIQSKLNAFLCDHSLRIPPFKYTGFSKMDAIANFFEEAFNDESSPACIVKGTKNKVKQSYCTGDEFSAAYRFVFNGIKMKWSKSYLFNVIDENGDKLVPFSLMLITPMTQGLSNGFKTVPNNHIYCFLADENGTPLNAEYSVFECTPEQSESIDIANEASFPLDECCFDKANMKVVY